ncbi:MAG TPA: nucleoside/nucleotide kinase family protein [Jatrophihabitantaceae bacterium]|nr:nucleoside/nucleotide kinase family protein [Jatrophihabitantaceae bacterium]
MDVAELADRARELAAHRDRTLIGIVGAPGAGKSTLAARVAEQVGDRAVVVGLDGFHLAQAELVRLGRADRKGAPDTFDALGYTALLRRLRDNTEPIVYAPLFRRDLEEAIAGAVPVTRETPIVITEGNYLLLDEPEWRGIRDLLDEIWYLDVDDDERRDRLTKRRMSYGIPEDEARRWTTGSDERNARTVVATRDRADLVVHL